MFSLEDEKNIKTEIRDTPDMVIFGYSQNHLSRPLATQINIKSSKTWKLTVKYLVFIFVKDKSLPNTIRFSALSLT